MSITDSLELNQTESPGTCSAIEASIIPEVKDLGGFSVRRLLPSVQRPMIGPWIFFDHMGPAQFPPGQGIDVRPHPHINLATVTYLFESHTLFYRVTTSRVEIIRVLHGRQDPQRHLK